MNMNWIRDILGLFGLGLFLFGLSQWSHALACVVGGVLLATGALFWSFLARRSA